MENLSQLQKFAQENDQIDYAGMLQGVDKAILTDSLMRVVSNLSDVQIQLDLLHEEDRIDTILDSMNSIKGYILDLRQTIISTNLQDLQS